MRKIPPSPIEILPTHRPPDSAGGFRITVGHPKQYPELLRPIHKVPICPSSGNNRGNRRSLIVKSTSGRFERRLAAASHQSAAFIQGVSLNTTPSLWAPPSVAVP